MVSDFIPFVVSDFIPLMVSLSIHLGGLGGECC